MKYAVRLSVAFLLVACMCFGVHLMILGDDARFYTCLGKSQSDVLREFGPPSSSWSDYFPNELHYHTGANVVRITLNAQQRVKWVAITPED